MRRGVKQRLQEPGIGFLAMALLGRFAFLGMLIAA
jgi:hypothetical protein